VSVAEQVTCATCGEPTPSAGRFCINCAAPLQQSCPSCGAPVVAGARFCMQCATPLAAGGPAGQTALAEPVSERRLVSVLFADLVGFTSLSEHRDPEEVRELLSRYFERCRAVIARYGGTVEKFIGDAVMAVWGTPVAREDDAERAVRAALALVQVVTALGEESGMPELRLRAGVLTGNAAVELGAEGEGMVLGDTVNTASRLQSIAAAGSVLVDDATHRASEAAIAYEDAGTHEVKGREQPVHAWTALRVVAGAGGARRSAGLEAPFVGRERELEAMVEAGEESAHERRARHTAVLGEAGSGKSRLLWEFFKYLDGIEEVRYWHQGRCLSYGEGVAYWALAEMVRARARIQEEEHPASAREKLRATVEQFVPEERERRLVEPRLAHLLRLEERPDADRADLFSGWRLFFERMSQEAPVILAFEDLQWADSGLLEFIDYLLEWSADFPIFVITLARTELGERRGTWESMTLSPLEPQAIATMLDGLVPGLPPDLVAEIIHRAEGIPLYAVETIRMLQDRGVLVQEGARYHLTRDVSDLEVPETLHALVASRLDGLSASERSLLQDASVLGQSVTAAAAAALSGLSEAEVRGVFDGLVAKQILGRDDDPRSPERGQYLFLQGLLRTVAYATLSRRARKTKHLSAANHLEQTWPGEARDIAEVVASHYQEAIRAEPDAEDAEELRAAARERLSTAGQAAASLALGSEADRYFDQAAELSSDELERAHLLEQAGRALWRSGDFEVAEVRLREAIELHTRNGRTSGGPAAVTLATAIATAGRFEEAHKLVKRFLANEGADQDRVLRAQALAAWANWLTLEERTGEAEPLFAEALATLEHARELPALAEAMARRAVFLQIVGRVEESFALSTHALKLAQQHDVPAVALRAMFTQVAVLLGLDQHREALPDVTRGLETARERGDRTWERMMLSELIQCDVFLGRWTEPEIALIPELLVGEHDAVTNYLMGDAAQVAAARGNDALLARCVELAARKEDAADPEFRAMARVTLAREAAAREALSQVIDLARPVVNAGEVSGELRTAGYALAVDATLTSGAKTAIDELLASLDALRPVDATPVRRAQRARLLAEQAHFRGDEESTAAREREAIELLRSVSARPLLADALLDSVRRRRDAGALAEARAIYEELGATRSLERIEARAEVAA
jgi:class 3 adenylate cyclase/tetratricopeptide (TPR) repeat protein